VNCLKNGSVVSMRKARAEAKRLTDLAGGRIQVEPQTDAEGNFAGRYSIIPWPRQGIDGSDMDPGFVDEAFGRSMEDQLASSLMEAGLAFLDVAFEIKRAAKLGRVECRTED